MPSTDTWAALTIPLRPDGTLATLHAPSPLTARDIAVMKEWFDWYEFALLGDQGGAEPGHDKEADHANP